MKLIDRFEKQYGKSVRELNIDSLNKLISNEKYSSFFKNPDNFLEILKEIKRFHTDEKFKQVLQTIISSVELVKTEATLDSVFASYKKDEIEKEELLEKVKTMIADENPIVSISAILCSFIGFDDFDISLEEFKKKFESLMKLYEELSEDFKISYKLRCDLLDILYSSRDEYFNKTSIDVVDSIKDFKSWEDNVLDALHSFEDKIIAENGLEPFKQVNIKPEELNLIDITKLKEKE